MKKLPPHLKNVDFWKRMNLKKILTWILRCSKKLKMLFLCFCYLLFKIFFYFCCKICLALSSFFVQRIFQNILKSSHDIIVLLKSIAVQKKYLKQNPWKLKQPQIYWNIVVNYLLHNYIWKGKCGLWWVNIFFSQWISDCTKFCFFK